jgi:hypothetical protein
LDWESNQNIELEAETLHLYPASAVAWAVQDPAGKPYRRRFRQKADNVRLSYKPIDPR